MSSYDHWRSQTSTEGHRVYPPAGYPHQGPHNPYGHTPYPPQQHLPPYPAPMPAPPWAPPGTPPQTNPTKPNRRGVIAAAVFGVVTMLLIFAGFNAISDKPGQYFTNGGQISPTADEYIVFISDKDLAGQDPSTVHCTATTASGERLTLSPPAESATVSRSRRPVIIYRPVAELPTDQGSLTVECTGTDARRLLLTTAATWGGVGLFFVGYAIFMAVLIGFVIISRRRYFRRYPRISGPTQWQS